MRQGLFGRRVPVLRLPADGLGFHLPERPGAAPEIRGQLVAGRRPIAVRDGRLDGGQFGPLEVEPVEEFGLSQPGTGFCRGGGVEEGGQKHQQKAETI